MNLRKLLKKFGLSTLLDAIEESQIYLQTDAHGGLTQESVEKAFNTLGGICRMSQQPEWKRELYYIRGIMRKRFSYCNEWDAIKFMENAYHEGVPLDELRHIACSARNWTAWVSTLTDAREAISG